MKRWALLIVGYTLVLGSTGLMLWLAWEFVALGTALLVGFGMAATGKQVGREREVWSPENYAQVAERLCQLYDYDVYGSHQVVGLAKKSIPGGRKERNPLECWQLITALHAKCPKEIKDRNHYVEMGLKTLSGDV